MTRLVVDPQDLIWLFPEASSSLPCRVRLVVQVVNYIDESGHLQVCRVAGVNLSHNATDPFLVNVGTVIDQLEPESVYGGAIVAIGGFWDGVDLNVFECQNISAHGLDATVLSNMSVLEPI